ncbi:MAG TPA: SDR family NAD(P)-dependent oxidoreductase [Pelobium sp.]
MMKNNVVTKVAIIGCGWLGFPLAKSLLALNYRINGSTTSKDKLSALAEKGIYPFLIDLDGENPVANMQQFLSVDLLIINIPPGRSVTDGDLYLKKLLYLKTEILQSTVQKVIFISSTSVYAENNAEQKEDSVQLAQSGSGLRMLNAENVFKNLPHIQTTIIRMAGLIGPKRHPGRFFAGKTDIPNGLAPVNLIHLNDCLGIIKKVITDGLWNAIFNAAAPTHPNKKEFYNLASEKLYGKSAEFIEEKIEFKIVNAEKIISKGYQFKHPDLMDCLQTNALN